MIIRKVMSIVDGSQNGTGILVAPKQMISSMRIEYFFDPQLFHAKIGSFNGQLYYLSTTLALLLLWVLLILNRLMNTIELDAKSTMIIGKL